MKQTIKQIAKKYLGTAIVGAGIVLGGFGNTGYSRVPENKDLREEYTKKCEGIEKKFKDFTYDQFSITEQADLLNEYRNLKNIENLMENPSSITELKNDNLHRLINKNLHGFDFKTPELEKYLSRKGVTVNVESCASETERISGILAFMLLVAGYAYFKTDPERYSKYLEKLNDLYKERG